jgi:ornithine cyclodeaminase/alanine dehydrogenase-like protein (mu-crystallin family)
VLRRADVIVATLVQQAKQDEQGDLLEPITKGLLQWQEIGELGPLVAGKITGRTDPKEITLFKQNSDQGVGFMALGKLAYDKARVAGIGTEI